MTASRGPYHNLAGPRLPSGPRNLGDEVEDPAHGAAVARCDACGHPNPITFGLSLHGRVCGRIQLCSDCFYHRNPIDPQSGDPLHVEAA